MASSKDPSQISLPCCLLSPYAVWDFVMISGDTLVHLTTGVASGCGGADVSGNEAVGARAVAGPC